MSDTEHYFFCGIGGSGMLPLAYLLNERGAKVAGSDRARDQGRLGNKFADMERRGITLYPQDGSGLVSGDQVLVASAAVEDTVPDVAAALKVGAKRLTRAELLASLFNSAAMRIAVGGTSGKSTTTGMIGSLLTQAGLDPTITNGAVMNSFVGPDQPFASAVCGAGDAFVTEVDESDGSIALFTPTIAVLNNVSIDHKPLPELRQLFGDFVARADVAVINADNEEAIALAERARRAVTFSLDDPSADFHASALTHRRDGVDFVLHHGGQSVQAHLPMPGAHNVANALAAIAASVAAGMDVVEAVRALECFKGIRRRLERVGTANNITVYDDFGHNPDKITATLKALHEFDGRLLLFFQPHGFGPLRLMKDELIACFTDHLHAQDVLLMPDPAYFGGTTDRSVGTQDILEGITKAGRDARFASSREAAKATLTDLAAPGDRVVVMGARDDTLSEFAHEILATL